VVAAKYDFKIDGRLAVISGIQENYLQMIGEIKFAIMNFLSDGYFSPSTVQTSVSMAKIDRIREYTDDADENFKTCLVQLEEKVLQGTISNVRGDDFKACLYIADKSPKTIKSTSIPTKERNSTLLPILTITPVVDQKSITNSIGMEFVWIPAGKFDMGSPTNEKDRTKNEAVQSVNISNAFYMGKYEVTQKQWRDVMGTNPSNWKGDNLPVEMVSWEDAQVFIKKLNEMEGGNKYRLPSESEWEYAARAGTTTRYSFGDDESLLLDYAWYDANSESKTHDVGQKKPNSWGLYDMHGNVWEWVDSWYNEMFFRGGGWKGYAGYCRSAAKRSAKSSGRYSDIGFRLMRGV
jgi:formylglycine-generating enzyme required for sulfatase activity